MGSAPVLINPGLHCPFCGHPDNEVRDSRPSEESIRRRRKCAACSKRFTTYEVACDDPEVAKDLADTRGRYTVINRIRRITDSLETLLDEFHKAPEQFRG